MAIFICETVSIIKIYIQIEIIVVLGYDLTKKNTDFQKSRVLYKICMLNLRNYIIRIPLGNEAVNIGLCQCCKYMQLF